MTHLGWATTPFVDDELDAQTREQVLVHLLLCQDCRREVEGLRRLKDAVRGLPAPTPPGSLTSRLSLLVELGPLPEPRRRSASYPSFVPPSVLAGRATATFRAVPRPSNPVRLDRDRLRRSALQGALVVLGLGGALALGAPPASAPSVARPAEPSSPQVVDLSMLTAVPGRPSRLQVVSAGYATRP